MNTFGESWAPIVATREAARLLLGDHGGAAQLAGIALLGLAVAATLGCVRLRRHLRNLAAERARLLADREVVDALLDHANADRRRLLSENSIPAVLRRLADLEERLRPILRGQERHLEMSSDTRCDTCATPRRLGVAATMPNVAIPCDTSELVAHQGTATLATPEVSQRTTPRKTAATPAATPKVSPRGVAPMFCDTQRDATPVDVVEWAAERLVDVPGYETRGGVLLQDFATWCGERGIVALGKDRFGPALEALGYSKVRKRNVMYQNVALKPPKVVQLNVIGGRRQ